MRPAGLHNPHSPTSIPGCTDTLQLFELLEPLNRGVLATEADKLAVDEVATALEKVWMIGQYRYCLVGGLVRAKILLAGVPPLGIIENVKRRASSCTPLGGSVPGGFYAW